MLNNIEEKQFRNIVENNAAKHSLLKAMGDFVKSCNKRMLRGLLLIPFML